MDILPQPIKNFIDAIFAPPLQFLQMIVDMLGNVSLVAGRGIDLNNYFMFFNYMPGSWQMVIKSLLASVTLLAVLFLVRATWNVYLNVKNSLKWW